MEVIHSAPEASSFVLLAEHQSRTPASFYSGPPVLHHHSKRCKVVILEADLLATPALNGLREPANGSAPSGALSEREVVIDGVDVWVTSDKFLLYAPSTSTGVAIPYPSICLHAIQRLQLPASSAEVQGLYMQIPSLATTAQVADDEEEDSITLTIVPPVLEEKGDEEGEEEVEKSEETPVQMLYAAVSACSNLHPDPVEDSDEDVDGGVQGSSLFQSGLIAAGAAGGALPPPVEGGSGWITAENMHEFFDEEGNWIADGEAPSLSLGPGAGTVRQRDEGENGVDAQDGSDDETKWRRTD
ncbi:hypothetical protein ASPZODRAFT_93016 [Penicilliopsis zonata CBS 506.65]|uniref:Regulator of volume decrease after cellular swelling-domain-containing protein n=1 Tax=Penicilliopsis zonata CBS 506.65 TaxID=1073090 RepID=A0A1L9SMG6_9EURO|nr:hypothetical protein ASPZODRAFT_93016 [Penicilliopsis zonata CBS 506.65]OJJ48415.1 hypothetical protein ASPZODRAFT_93016 [Penicilliopsis zonata CBS 506.65]